MASQCVSTAVCGSVFVKRVAKRITEGGRMSDGYTPRNVARPLAYKVSSPCPLSNVDRRFALLIYPDTFFLFEV